MSVRLKQWWIFDGQIMTANTPKKFFGSNSFYTTVGNRMSRSMFDQAVTVSDVIQNLREYGL